MSTQIFVFGSNLAGRHGAGSALEARRNHGAIYGRGVGRQGWSYAIPTKDFELKTLPLEQIKMYVDEFLEYAEAHPELTFYVVRIGCGLACYTDAQISPLFKDASVNCDLPHRWTRVRGYRSFGTSTSCTLSRLGITGLT